MRDVEPYDAIVLAGGRARRAQGRKLALRRGGRTLLAHAVAAVATARRIVLVGPEPPASDVPDALWCREDPPYAGPVAAVAAGLVHVTADRVIVLAGDQPQPGPAVTALLRALTPDVDAAVLVDREQVLQPLLAAYTRRWLAERTATGAVAARALLDGARLARVADRWDAAADIDTLDDAQRHGFSPY